MDQKKDPSYDEIHPRRTLDILIRDFLVARFYFLREGFWHELNKCREERKKCREVQQDQ